MIRFTRKDLDRLSETYGDAFYILDDEVFESNYKELTESFKNYYPKFNIAYSYKTNYIPKLVQIVDRLGGYAEVVSDMEMEIAHRAGVRANHIIWNGPVKNKDKVGDLLLQGGTVNIDSIYELDNFRKIIKRYPNHTLNIGIRCNYDVGDGVLSRFGFDVEGPEFAQALRYIAMTPNIHLLNLQAHFANRLPEFWTARAEGMLKIYDRVVREFGLSPECLDIGGGIYGKMPAELASQLGIGYITYDDYASKSAKIFADYFYGMPNPPYLFIEPGSALAGDCMKFVCRVETIKIVRGKPIATVIGSQKNISVPNKPPLEIVAAGNKQKEYNNLDIVGFTCIEGDVLYKNYTGPLAIGDYVVISNCGSYSLVMKPPFILPNFPVIKSDGNLIKRAEVFDDLFCTFTF